MNPPTSATNTPAPRPLLGLTVTLLALLVLNLTLFDDLRTEPSLGLVEIFTKPPHLASLVTGALAVALVARGHRHGARVALVVAWLQLVAFAVLHLLPVETGPTKPYWGDAMGDALQWVGLLLIMGCCAAIIAAATQARRSAGVSVA